MSQWLPTEELEAALARLPGFGQRSARRAALALVKDKQRLLEPLSTALRRAATEIVKCPVCGAFTRHDQTPCRFCTDQTRDDTLLCVVEDPADIAIIESSGAFRGRYHTLGGKLSPARHLGPEAFDLGRLAQRIASGSFAEILLALSTDMEGDATASLITDLLGDLNVKITRLAFGLPADSGVAYSDPLTLKRAIMNRIAQ